MSLKNLLIGFIFCTLFACNDKKKDQKNAEQGTINSEIYMIVGSYTNGSSKGIYVYKLDTITGKSEYVSNIEIANPSYLALNGKGTMVYSVTENEDSTSAVNSFSFDKKSGHLKLINSVPSGGAAPCYIALAPTEKHLVTANYLGESISTFSINDDGSINSNSKIIQFRGKGLDKERQNSPHLHCTIFGIDGKHLYATDLGTDQIYKFNVGSGENFLSEGTPKAFKVTPGSGPRHLTFHPNGKYAYLITELSGDVLAFNYTDGNLSQFQAIKADSLNAAGSADIHISPDGKYLYASNRLKGDGIAIFSIDETNGHLTKIGYQPTNIHPRNFAITPTGNLLLVACRDSNSIQVFKINRSTGLLTDAKENINLDKPVCIKFTSLD